MTPRMLTIKATATEFNLSEYCIRQLCRTGKIVYVRSGTKYLVNADRFCDFLNHGNAENPIEPTNGTIRRVDS